MRNFQGILLAAALAIPGIAAAQTDYTADQVVKHFAGDGASRCITIPKPAGGGGSGVQIDGAVRDDSRCVTVEGAANANGKSRGVTFGATGFGDAKEDGGKPEGSAEPAALSADAFNLSVTFDLDSDHLTGRAERNLLEFAKALQRPELKSVKFSVDGHTDDTGTKAYNKDLSERRAMAVVRFLTANGVERDRLVPRGFGETQPVGTNAENRRVETRVLE